MRRLTKLLAQTVAAMAIAVFWCISTISTVGTTVGVSALTTAVTAAFSTPAEAGRRWRGRRRWGGRRWRGRRHYGGYPYLLSALWVRLSLLLQSPARRHLVRLLAGWGIPNRLGYGLRRHMPVGAPPIAFFRRLLPEKEKPTLPIA